MHLISRRMNDSCTVLVIMHYWDIQFFFQPVFYLETFGSLDIFQVDASEGRGNGFYCLDEFSGSFSFTSMSNTSIPA